MSTTYLSALDRRELAWYERQGLIPKQSKRLPLFRHTYHVYNGSRLVGGIGGNSAKQALARFTNDGEFAATHVVQKPKPPSLRLPTSRRGKGRTKMLVGQTEARRRLKRERDWFISQGLVPSDISQSEFDELARLHADAGRAITSGRSRSTLANIRSKRSPSKKKHKTRKAKGTTMAYRKRRKSTRRPARKSRKTHNWKARSSRYTRDSAPRRYRAKKRAANRAKHRAKRTKRSTGRRGYSKRYARKSPARKSRKSSRKRSYARRRRY